MAFRPRPVNAKLVCIEIRPSGCINRDSRVTRIFNSTPQVSDAARDELFQRCWDTIWPIAYSLLGNRHLAEDAAQEAMARIFRGLDAFDSQRAIEPWARKVATNTILNELRRHKRAPIPAEWIADVDDSDSAATANGIALAEEAAPIREAVAGLPPEKRVIVVLHYWLDYPLRDIATMLEIPMGTVASHLSRAREQLRARLEAEHVRRP
jgi:RNA polymerase sigma-70 factor, ECF subfamily